MIWSVVTVVCYSISSLGDKFISKKMKCSSAEFAFIVAIATILWIGVFLPFSGWGYHLSVENLFLTAGLVLCKLVEFYSSAILLKTVSAYELKAWLGINILFSYYCNVLKGKQVMQWCSILLGILLLVGIFMIVSEQKKQLKKCVLLFIFFILAKFFYGFLIGMFSKDCSVQSILFIVMIFVALIQLPAIRIKEVLKKEGKGVAFLTRLPNAVGLMCEAIAAQANIFLYAMIQPLQLVVLFVHSIIKKEPMKKTKVIGSIMCIVAVFLIALLK